MVALTGWGQEEDRARSREAGFDGHLVKPVDYRALMELLASSCRSARTRLPARAFDRAQSAVARPKWT